MFSVYVTLKKYLFIKIRLRIYRQAFKCGKDDEQREGPVKSETLMRSVQAQVKYKNMKRTVVIYGRHRHDRGQTLEPLQQQSAKADTCFHLPAGDTLLCRLYHVLYNVVHLGVVPF